MGQSLTNTDEYNMSDVVPGTGDKRDPKMLLVLAAPAGGGSPTSDRIPLRGLLKGRLQRALQEAEKALTTTRPT